MEQITQNAPSLLSAAGQGMSIMGQVQQGQAAADTGASQQGAYEFQARQLEVNAGQQVASGQAAAFEQERQARLASSRALAVAAASGGGASDPTVINLIARISGEGTYRSMVALYQGEENARQMRDNAAAARYNGQIALEQGKAKQTAANMGAFGNALSGASSLFSKYASNNKPSSVSSGPDYSNTDFSGWTDGGFGGSVT